MDSLNLRSDIASLSDKNERVIFTQLYFELSHMDHAKPKCIMNQLDYYIKQRFIIMLCLH